MVVELKKPDISRYVYSRVEAIADAIGVGGRPAVVEGMRTISFRVFAAREIGDLVDVAGYVRPVRNGRRKPLRKGELPYSQQVQASFDAAKAAQQDKPAAEQLSDEMLVIQLKPDVAYRFAQTRFAGFEHRDEIAQGLADLTHEIHAHPLLIGRETDQAAPTDGYL